MKQYLEGIGLLLGMIIGAGIFGLPYALAQAGIFWGFVHFALALTLLLVVSLMYGEITFATAERHRFVGYVRTYLGKWDSRLSLILILFGNYGALLVYGLLGGIFLNNIFGLSAATNAAPAGAGGNEAWFVTAFFVVGALVARMRFEKAGAINFYLTIPLLGFILYLAAAAGKYFDPANLVWDTSFNAHWFLPYGVWLFALSGFTVIPEVRDIMRERGIRGFKFVIWTSTLLAAAFSLLFALMILAATGAGTTEEVLAGLRAVLGAQAILIGSIIGLLAVLTSYIATAQDFKEIFKTDYRINGFAAWLLVVLPPVALYFWRVPGLVSALSFLGAISFGVSGYFILRMSEKVRGVPGLSVSNFAASIKIVIGLGIVLGSFYEVYQTFI
ncbi:MAG: hypothetical protein HZA25_00500 [Candidatus Niyogibacteria bacterium]|nr:hypothetical protein [Candidatus Niyogibacteria bacterium]